jgi:predicted lipoprotein
MRRAIEAMNKPLFLSALALGAVFLLGGCKLVPTGQGGAETAAAAFDPDKAAAEMWEPKMLPYLRVKAGPLAEVQDLAARDPKAAGEKYGNPKKQASAPWTFATRFEGTIVAANTESRAASIDVDVDGDAKADARVQIGPALRGTALRDALDFVDFNQFTNQIDFAQFGKALNTYANTSVLEKLPRDSLVGRHASVTGAYPAPSGGALPLVAPAEITIGPKP